MLFLLAAALALVSPFAAATVSLRFDEAQQTATLSNAFVQVTFNTLCGCVTGLYGRFEGDADFSNSQNVAATLPRSTWSGIAYDGASVASFAGPARGAFSLIVTGDGVSYAETATSSFVRSTPLAVTSLANNSVYAAFSVGGITDSVVNARVGATFTFSLAQNDRSLGFNVSATALRPFNTSLVRLSTAWSPASTLAQYDTGVRQGLNNPPPFIASSRPLQRFIGLGYTGAVDVTPVALPPAGQTILYAGDWNGKRSGLDVVLAGRVLNDLWLENWIGNPIFAVAEGTAFPPVALRVSPNNYDFPAGLVSPNNRMDVTDLRSVLTAVYSAPYSALHSLDYAPQGRIAPCPNIRGDVCYGGLYNFFDPDSFISVSAMLYSFDPAVHAEARKLLETNAQFFCGPDTPQMCEEGQMMHHFLPSCDPKDPQCYCPAGAYDCVTYAAISGAIQTGPNIFWTAAALRYAALSGNYSWLTEHFPSLRTSMGFLLARFDTSVGLFNVPGSLWIDTFIRANYTSDTNAGILFLLDLMADAETFVGNATGAVLYADTAAQVRGAMNTYLWSASHDHYCTNSNPLGLASQSEHEMSDERNRQRHESVTAGLANCAITDAVEGVQVCARDFVDYDSNLLAVAFGVPATPQQAQAILARVDRGPNAHIRGTWVSEVYYDAANCESQNTGDSAVTMGRIAWADGLARKAVGDAANAAFFNASILQPLQYELLSNTWMNERYDAQAAPTHNPFYIEYGEVVAMLLFEVKYGISVGFTYLTVDPLSGVTDYEWSLGGFRVAYHAGGSFVAALPYSGTKAFTVTRMAPGVYTVSSATGAGAGGASVSLTRDGDGAEGVPITRRAGGKSRKSVRGDLLPQVPASRTSFAGPTAGKALQTATNVTVGADGILRFSAQLAPGVTVSATKQ